MFNLAADMGGMGFIETHRAECMLSVLGSSELVSINRLVDIVEEIAGVKLARRYNLGAPKGVRGRNSDNTLIRQLLGWEPDVPLRTGLEQTYAWIRNQMAVPTLG